MADIPEIKLTGDVKLDGGVNVTVQTPPPPPPAKKPNEGCDKCESLKLKLDFAKFLLGTVLLGILGWYTNFSHNEKEIAVKQIDAETQQLDKFLTHFEKDTGAQQRYDFANYMAHVAILDSTRAHYRDYASIILVKDKDQSNTLTDKIESFADSAKVNPKGIAASSSAIFEIQNQAFQLSMKTDITKQTLAIAPTIERKVDTIKTATMPNSDVKPVPIFPQKILNQDGQWCKPGYFNSYDEDKIHIGVIELKRDQGYVKFNINNYMESDFNTMQLKIGESSTLITGKYGITIKLVDIDKRGSVFNIGNQYAAIYNIVITKN